MAVAEADEKGTGGQLGGERLAVEDGTGGGQGGEYTRDGSVDLRGNPVLRSKRGGWTACAFIVVYELFERMAYYGIASNLVIYLTEKLHQGTVEASNNVTNWSGTVFLTPLLGAYVADAYLGRYWTFVVGSAIYFMVIYRCTGTLRTWSLLHRENVRDLFTEVCVRLEDTARDLFTSHGWQHNLRIGYPAP